MNFSKSLRHLLWFMVAGLSMASVVSCRDDASVSEAEIAALQQRLDSINVEYERLRAAGSEYAGALSSKDSMIQVQSDEIQSLIIQLRRARASASQGVDANAGALREKNAQIAQLRSQLDVQSKQLKKLEEAARHAGDGTSAEMQRQIDRCREQVSQQERLIADLNRQIAGLNGQVEAQTGTISSLSGEKAALALQVMSLERQVSELGERMASMAQDKADTRQLADCQQRVSQLQGEADQLHAQIGALQDQIRQSGDDSRQSAALGQQVALLNQQVVQLQAQLEQRDARINGLVAQQDAAGKSGQQAAAQIAALQQQVAQQQADIERLNAEVNAKEAELKQARSAASKSAQTATAATAGKKLGELQELCESYAREIEQLRAENARLHSENEQLRDEMAQVQRDAEKALTDNSKLEQKVALASILVADGLTATPAKSISGNTIKPTEKASQVVGVRIEGRLLDNNVVDPGTITIYARLATANNRIVANGTPEDFDMQGVSMQYTLSQDIEFTGAGRKVSMVWRKLPATEMPAGLYWLTLYANGHEIGKTSFLLK